MSQISFEFDLTHHDPMPVYHQLENAIQEYIENGKLKVDELLPPERTICKLNNLSLSTVRKALQNLAQKGYLYRIQGKGTFVANAEIRRNNIRYYSLVKEFDGKNSMPAIRFVKIERIPGQERICRQLHIEPDQELYKLQRVISFDNEPTVYCISYLPCALFPDMDQLQPSQIEDNALYIMLEKTFGVSTMRNCDLYGAVSADKMVAQKLGVKPGQPLLLVEMLAITHKDKPFEYRISYCRADARKIRREY